MKISEVQKIFLKEMSRSINPKVQLQKEKDIYKKQLKDDLLNKIKMQKTSTDSSRHIIEEMTKIEDKSLEHLKIFGAKINK